jgi:antitoxin MazE
MNEVSPACYASYATADARRLRITCPQACPLLYISKNGAGMRKKLSAIGNSLGLVIEKPILELLDIDRDTELDLRTDGERLIIEPIRGRRTARVKAAVQRAMATHDATLRKLAK